MEVLKRETVQSISGRYHNFPLRVCAVMRGNKCSKVISGKACAHKWGSSSWGCWGFMRSVYAQSSCIRYDINVDKVEERWIPFLLLLKEYISF